MNGYQVLEILRSRLKTEFPDFNHLIGLRAAEEAKISDYPFFFYSVEREELDKSQQYETHETIILVGILEKTYDEAQKLYLGVKKLLEVVESIKNTLKQEPTLGGQVLNSKVSRVFTDLGIRHPFYHAEVHVEVLSRA